MEQEQATATLTTREVGIRYGLISAVVGIFYFVLITMAGMQMQGPAGYLGYLITAAIIFLAHKYYKDNGNGYMSYGQGIGIAFWCGLISSVISSVFVFIYASYIDSSFIQNIKDLQLEQMEKQGLSEAEIEQAMKIAGAFTSPAGIAGMGFIGGIITALIIAVIVTIFTQKKDPQATI